MGTVNKQGVIAIGQLMHRCFFMGLLVSVLTWVLCGLPNVASAWSKQAHRMITEDAHSVLPASVKAALSPHIFRLGEGSLAPDNVYKPPQEHSLNPDGTGNADNLLEDFAKEAEELIRQKASWDKIAYALGEASHMIQDLNQPQHTDKGEGKNHKPYEGIAFIDKWPRPGTKDGYDGFDHYTDYKAMAYHTASWSRQFFGDVQDGPYGFGEVVMPVIGTTWNHAVNDVADLWLSILLNAQQGMGPMVDIPQPLRVPKIQKPGCLLAAALEGTRYADLLNLFRTFRDKYLQHSIIGPPLIASYYEFSHFVLSHGLQDDSSGEVSQGAIWQQ